MSTDDWRKPGRCSSCRLFEEDFGAVPDIYGHCKMYPRSGSRQAIDFACGQYAPADGFDDLTKSTDHERNFTDPDYFVRGRAERARSTGTGGRSRAEYVERPKLPSVERAMEAWLGEGGDMDRETIRDVLVGVIENFIAVEEVEMSGKWIGGTVEVKPADGDLQSSEIPIDALFKKVVSVRNQLRVLESKINGHGSLDDGQKIELQQYISRCYGSLTTFNILFKDKQDKFSSS